MNTDRVTLVPFTDADLPPGAVVCDVAEVAPTDGGLVITETDIPEGDE